MMKTGEQEDRTATGPNGTRFGAATRQRMIL